MRRKIGNNNAYVDVGSVLLGIVIMLIVFFFVTNTNLFQWETEGNREYSTDAIAWTIESWGEYMFDLERENQVLKDRIEVLEHTGYYQAYLSLQGENDELNIRIALLIVFGVMIMLLWAFIVMYWYYERIAKFKKTIDKRVKEGLHDYKETMGKTFADNLADLISENKRLKTELKIKDKEYELKDLKRELK